jgi:hypothetical protein
MYTCIEEEEEKEEKEDTLFTKYRLSLCLPLFQTRVGYK